MGGRKTLPKSFLNRFNKIYLEDLTHFDYQTILQRQLLSNDHLKQIDVSGLLLLSRKLETLIKEESHLYQDEGAINMRDLSRFLQLYETSIKEGNSHDNSFVHAFEVSYLTRL